MGIVGERIRKQVYRKCNGNCAYCGKQVDLKGPQGFQVDHLHPTYWNWDDAECARNNVVRGTDDVENLMPACRRCNKWKAALSVEAFREEIRLQHERQVRDNTSYKLLVDYGMIKMELVDVVFYFEKMAGFKTTTSRTTSTIAV